jgi:carbon monoxide dehydrogenase subunit G
MELTNEFKVGVPVEQAWSTLTDVRLIAPCMPGAELREVEGDEYRGVVKVKVGPITAEYRGKATFLERDEAGHKAVLRAEGRETRGQGNAAATITADLTPEGDGTQVRVVTDLQITGRVAQFGRGVLGDVSTKLLGQFVECLESTVLTGGSPQSSEAAPSTGAKPPAGDGASAVGDAGVSGDGPGEAASHSAQPVDLIDVAGMSVVKRMGPLVAGVAGLLITLWMVIRWRRSG